MTDENSDDSVRDVTAARGELNPGDIFALPDYKLPARTKKRRFKPWHKPRKQYIRDLQWNREIAWLLRNRSPDKPLRYLGLPGTDLLDLRHFYNTFCRKSERYPDGRELRFLGFDTAAHSRSAEGDALNVSLDEMVGSGRLVDPLSDVRGDRFQTLATYDSVAWRQARQLGPYDIINVDLCGSVGEEEVTIDSSIYSALHNLAHMQLRNDEPWAIFLTTRVKADLFSESALAKLIEFVDRNLSDCAEFRVAADDYLDGMRHLADPIDQWGCQQFFDTATLGILKWLLEMVGRSSRCVVSVSSAAAYKVEGSAPCVDMLSVVLRFVPIAHPQPDSSGMSGIGRIGVSECEQAAHFPQAVAATVDVDKLLAEDAQVQQVCIERASLLMQEARYDGDDYEEWIKHGYPSL
ncbi:PP_RS20740 family protein [Kribbella soli]|uniref:Uncharacterized protein n=1 Tax=Kribbella soli TaxID=1124743 RepID=A0A4R0HHW1_9ACTN|nr:hypothetical protein [Kribbella soli]TCC10897.1 hypothetical protein E0H45_06230 [Kribbella soli]